MNDEDRSWEEAYRRRWQHDKIVRSTHGVNCTGSCSWKIYVKGGIVTWETQQTDYPRTRPDLPNHEPRGCARGASYSWYLYSGNRVKYPLVRGRLLKLWREARKTMPPVQAWASIVENPEQAQILHLHPRRRRSGALALGRSHRADRRGQRLHGQEAWARSRVRLLADPGDVDDLLCGRRALSAALGRRLRLIL
jgi:nitrate reductase alpha subunit